jgi:DNA-binding transcriptional ArsR family regulator
MAEGPDIARLGALLGDPARANMMSALMGGKALTASELSSVAGIGVSTGSSHLAKLESGGLVRKTKQGRHRYYALSDDHVVALLEQVMGFAARLGHDRLQTGPKDQAMREARICYNHLAGERGVRMFDFLMTKKFLFHDEDRISVTKRGNAFFADFQIDVAKLTNLRRPLCRNCLDWSERRNHLAGPLAEKLLIKMTEAKWVRRDDSSRALLFSPLGRKTFDDTFGVA